AGQKRKPIALITDGKIVQRIARAPPHAAPRALMFELFERPCAPRPRARRCPPARRRERGSPHVFGGRTLSRMGTRPVSIAVVGWLFVVVGCASLARHAWEITHAGEGGAATAPSAKDLEDFAWVVASAALAMAGGAFTLRGRKWARWALVVWMAGH